MLKFDVTYQKEYSRGELLLRTFFGWIYIVIPHMFALYFLGIAVSFMNLIAFFAVLINGTYPRSFFDFIINVYRWSMNVNASLYNLVDGYPPFGFDKWEKVTFDVDYELEEINRVDYLVRMLFGWIYAGIPHAFVLMIRFMVVSIISIIAFWVVLFTGKYPEGMHAFVVGTYRWQLRLNLYLSYMIKDYPPFSGE